LTTSAPGEPRSNSPTDTRTYLRIVPSDSVQAAAILLAMNQAGCVRAAVVDDRSPYGMGLATLIGAEKSLYSTNVVSVAGIDPSARALRAYATNARAQRPDCYVLAGAASPSAVKLTGALHALRPTAKFFAPGAMCNGSWTNPRHGGVPPSIGRLIECTSVTRSLRAYPGGKAFLAAYRARFGTAASPSAYAILGYEAMKLGLSTIAGLGAEGDSKSDVRTALFSITDRHSVLGTYGFDQNGDTTLRSYGLYRVGASGNPVFVRTITPPRVS
jgi:branched-chain amino acid transport system substrate-binding protein